MEGVGIDILTSPVNERVCFSMKDDAAAVHGSETDHPFDLVLSHDINVVEAKERAMKILGAASEMDAMGETGLMAHGQRGMMRRQRHNK